VRRTSKGRTAILADDESVALMAAALGAVSGMPVLLAEPSKPLPRATRLFLDDWRPRDLLDLRDLRPWHAADTLLQRWPGRPDSVVIADLTAQPVSLSQPTSDNQADYVRTAHLAGALAGVLEVPLLPAGPESSILRSVQSSGARRAFLVTQATRLRSAFAEAGLETQVVANEVDLLKWFPQAARGYAVVTHEREGVLPGILAAYRHAPVLHLPQPLVDLSRRWAHVADLIHVEALHQAIRVKSIRDEAESALQASRALAGTLSPRARARAEAAVDRLRGLWSLVPELPEDREQALRWAEYLFIDGPLSYLPPLWNGLVDEWLGGLGLNPQTLAVVALTGLTLPEGPERASDGFGLAQGTIPLTFDVAAAHRRAVGRIDGLSLADGAALIARAACPVQHKSPSRAVLWSTTVEAVPDILEQRALLAAAFDRLEEGWFAGRATRGEWPLERALGPDATPIRPATWRGLKGLLQRGASLVVWTGHGGATADVDGRQLPGVGKLTFPPPRRTYATTTYVDPPGIQPYRETRWATGASGAVNQVVSSAQVESEVGRLRSAVVYLGGCVLGSSETPLVLARLGAAAVLSYLTETGDESARFLTEILREVVAGTSLGEAVRRAWELGIDHPVPGFNAHQIWLLGDPALGLPPGPVEKAAARPSTGSGRAAPRFRSW
jgi:hypothetical protein